VKTRKISRVIVLGMDGLDPNILEAMMESGQLPAFSLIKEKGTYRRLATINPPQSPVVWSAIATGSNPGYHGIFTYSVICLSSNPNAETKYPGDHTTRSFQYTFPNHIRFDILRRFTCRGTPRFNPYAQWLS